MDAMAILQRQGGCNSTASGAAFTTIAAFHDTCEHDDVPEFVEAGIHDYEESCEAYLCNSVEAGYKGGVCNEDDKKHDPEEMEMVLAGGALFIVLAVACYFQSDRSHATLDKHCCMDEAGSSPSKGRDDEELQGESKP